MKRILALVLTVALCCTLFVGCGKSDLYYSYDMKDYVTVKDYSTEIDKETTDYDYAVEAFYNQTFGENLKQKLESGKVENGDVANIDYKGTLNGVAFDGGTATGYDLEIGAGQFIDGFEEGLIGVDIGTTVNLDLKFPDSYHSADLAGKAVVFEVKVNYVTRNGQPTEENIKRYGFSSLADYEKKQEEYALGLCLYYNIYRNSQFNNYPKKEFNLLYNYLLTYYEDACKENNMTMKDLAEANQMSEDELYDYLKEYEVQGKMEFYMTAYYVLGENDAKLTKEEVEAKKAELVKQNEGKTLEEVGYNQINIEQAAAYDKALEILAGQATAKK